MDNPTSIFENYLKLNGLKLTKPRKIIFDMVFKTHTHFNVDELYEIIKKKHNQINIQIDIFLMVRFLM